MQILAIVAQDLPDSCEECFLYNSSQYECRALPDVIGSYSYTERPCVCPLRESASVLVPTYQEKQALESLHAQLEKERAEKRGYLNQFRAIKVKEMVKRALDIDLYDWQALYAVGDNRSEVMSHIRSNQRQTGKSLASMLKVIFDLEAPELNLYIEDIDGNSWSIADDSESYSLQSPRRRMYYSKNLKKLYKSLKQVLQEDDLPLRTIYFSRAERRAHDYSKIL